MARDRAKSVTQGTPCLRQRGIMKKRSALRYPVGASGASLGVPVQALENWYGRVHSPIPKQHPHLVPLLGVEELLVVSRSRGTPELEEPAVEEYPHRELGMRRG
jgi:hypothetical protein